MHFFLPFEPFADDDGGEIGVGGDECDEAGMGRGGGAEGVDGGQVGETVEQVADTWGGGETCGNGDGVGRAQAGGSLGERVRASRLAVEERGDLE